MSITTKQCKEYIVSWYGKNRTALPILPFVQGQQESDGSCGGLNNGLRVSAWSRVAKKRIGDKTYRAFAPSGSVVDVSVLVIIIEQGGAIVGLEHGLVDQFVGPGKYFESL